MSLTCSSAGMNPSSHKDGLSLLPHSQFTNTGPSTTWRWTDTVLLQNWYSVQYSSLIDSHPILRILWYSACHNCLHIGNLSTYYSKFLGELAMILGFVNTSYSSNHSYTFSPWGITLERRRGKGLETRLWGMKAAPVIPTSSPLFAVGGGGGG